MLGFYNGALAFHKLHLSASASASPSPSSSCSKKMAATAAVFAVVPAATTYNNVNPKPVIHYFSRPAFAAFAIKRNCFPSSISLRRGCSSVLACLPPSSSSDSRPKTRLFVSGLSFRTTEESLRNAFQGFGQLVDVNLVMDKIANRPRGFAFLNYATEEESQKAIEGMHGKVLLLCKEINVKAQDDEELML